MRRSSTEPGTRRSSGSCEAGRQCGRSEGSSAGLLAAPTAVHSLGINLSIGAGDGGRTRDPLLGKHNGAGQRDGGGRPAVWPTTDVPALHPRTRTRRAAEPPGRCRRSALYRRTMSGERCRAGCRARPPVRLKGAHTATAQRVTSPWLGVPLSSTPELRVTPGAWTIVATARACCPLMIRTPGGSSAPRYPRGVAPPRSPRP